MFDKTPTQNKVNSTHRNHNLFKSSLLINLMVDEEKPEEEAPKPDEEGEKALEEKAKELEESNNFH